MNNKSLKTYGTRTDKAMKTVVRLEKTSLKITNLTINYLLKHNLTFNQFKVLEVLYHLGDLNIGSITKLTMSTPGNITVVVKNLKRDNWITSVKDPNDNRASILSITQKGKEIIEEVFPNHAKNLTKAMEVLNDQELDTLYGLLNKVYKAN
ncbi:MarR family winged helix-turn-helix transcriptional regulator [Aliarcobacter butzleri]|uniref:MarR family winged helix-turn-helix transcriptional regulator n=1 Tax=Aliarcobacter butzleri TaxID=28197 RepID=UPI000F48A78A|nr:MarR family transcriptional regulator [Aliarcobacter butzleri]MCG3697131.1 MarR family transcriptional regulator [Aliarcobacter butzleri]MCG3699601.1 MarR family transcriptional regulator [Aliarcobacter butzleri]MDK2046392.1 MarR family transcriptional regulator [Aliarcobacter butzleri]MDN5079859.1 MarR family transcriptional regulator [Aliarcobacter butzleri]MDN5092023.1 MarR family transcriptional regulator [Aliarcobacter butzleri]